MHFLLKLMDMDTTDQSTSEVAFMICLLMMQFVVFLALGTNFIGKGLVKNQNETLLEYLAEETLKTSLRKESRVRV